MVAGVKQDDLARCEGVGAVLCSRCARHETYTNAVMLAGPEVRWIHPPYDPSSGQCISFLSMENADVDG